MAPTIVVPTAPAVASILTPAASAAVVATPIVDNGTTSTSTVSVPAAVIAPAAPAIIFGPPYSQLPPNTPSNAILPPPHLVTVGHGYHVPGPNDSPPFYVITRGRNIGVFSGWSVNLPTFLYLTANTDFQGEYLAPSYWH